MAKERNLTIGGITAGIWAFALPLMLGNVMQQFYNLVNKPLMSVVLTVISLGTRVALAYLLSGIDRIGVVGIWAAIPIGWFLSDAAGIVYYIKKRTAPYDI